MNKNYVILLHISIFVASCVGRPPFEECGVNAEIKNTTEFDIEAFIYVTDELGQALLADTLFLQAKTGNIRQGGLGREPVKTPIQILNADSVQFYFLELDKRVSYSLDHSSTKNNLYYIEDYDRSDKVEECGGYTLAEYLIDEEHVNAAR
ncbi:MAG: hypothetical protein ACJAZ3_000951 [Sphingobacteriales bacterium]|jgi:hypothetical protein